MSSNSLYLSPSSALHQLYPTREIFHDHLSKLSKRSFGKFLTVAPSGAITETNLFDYAMKKLKGSLRQHDMDSRLCLGLRVIKLIDFGMAQHWILEEDLPHIQALAARAGIIPPKVNLSSLIAFSRLNGVAIKRDLAISALGGWLVRDLWFTIIFHVF